MQIRKKITDLFKYVDCHGAPVSFTYNNSMKHKTAFGGFITLGSRISILVYFMIQMQNVIQKDGNIRTKSVYISKTYDEQSYPITLDNFDLAFGMIPSDGKPHLAEKENISRYLNIEVSYLEHFYIDSDNGVRIPSKK